MRKTTMALIAFGATALAGVTSTTPAAAYDYPWCASGPSLGYPGECAYVTYEQCLASVSGRYLACSINPRVAFGQAPQPLPSPPPRRGRHHVDINPY